MPAAADVLGAAERRVLLDGIPSALLDWAISR
jgi:hypothetical protein